MAQDIHQKEAVLSARVASTEHHARARAPVDVGDAEGAIALDRHVRPRAFLRRYIAFLYTKGGVLEVAGDLFAGQRRRGVEKVGIERQLVREVRWEGDVELKFGELRPVVEAVLAS